LPGQAAAAVSTPARAGLGHQDRAKKKFAVLTGGRAVPPKIRAVVTQQRRFTMQEFLGVGDVARELGCMPRDISDCFYSQQLDESKCVRIAGRRAIPRSYVVTIRKVLSQLGKLSCEAEEVAG
jgi:hypothetical protein